MSNFRKVLLAFAAVTLCAGIASAGLTVAPAPIAPAILPAETETHIVVAQAQDIISLLNETSGYAVGTAPTFLSRNEPMVLLILVDDPAQPPGAITNNNPEPAIEPLTPDATTTLAPPTTLSAGTLNLNFTSIANAWYPTGFVVNAMTNGASATNNNRLIDRIMVVDVGTAHAWTIDQTTATATPPGPLDTGKTVAVVAPAPLAVDALVAAVVSEGVARSGPETAARNAFGADLGTIAA